MMLIKLLAFMIAACLTSCVTTPKPVEKHVLKISEIKARLKLVREVQDLGFEEKEFNACDLGFKDQDCANEYLAVIQFQLLCRQSEGTVNEAPELIPVQSDSINWKLGDVTGITQTDAQGFGTVEARRPTPSAATRLRLTIEDRFVAVPAGEATRLVVPQDWCPSRPL